MAGFFATKGPQPAPTLDRTDAMLQTAVSTQSMLGKVAAFKAVFDPQPEIIDNGQFVYYEQFKGDFFQTMALMLSTKLIVGAPAQQFKDLWLKGLDAATTFAINNSASIAKDPTKAAAFQLDSKLRSDMEAIAGKDSVDMLFPPTAELQKSIASIVAYVIPYIENQLSILDLNVTAIPLKTGSNVGHILVAAGLAADKCFKTCGRIARIHRLTTKVTLKSFGRLGAMVPSTNSESLAFARLNRNLLINPRLVNYGATASTARMLNTLITTLDANLIVRAGVFSGEAYEKPFSDFPEPEHYLVLLAALPLEEFRAVAFLYWDPDVVSTKLMTSTSATRFPSSFGFVFAYYAPGPSGKGERLFFSTGFSPSDLVYSKPLIPPGHDMNFHPSDKKRHRYQVVSLFNP